MLSLVELERVAHVLSNTMLGGRVERWVEPERGRLCLSIYQPALDAVGRSAGDENSASTGRKKFILHLDARPEKAHLGCLPRMPKAPDAMPAFCAYLRAHLSRARLESVSIRGGDRQLDLEFSAREGHYHLLLSIFGRKSNLYLLDRGDRILQVLRPLADTRPELKLGDRFSNPGTDVPKAGKDRFESKVGLALLDAIGAVYAKGDASDSAADDRRVLMRSIQKDRKSTARRVARLEAELAEATHADRLAREGELLKANLGRIESGADSVEVDPWEGSEKVRIALDPKLTAKENLAAIFKRYQKLLRRLTKAGGQVDQAREALAKLDAIAADLEAASDAATLATLLERDDVRALQARHARRAQGAPQKTERSARKPPAAYRDLPRKVHPRRYASIDGLEIWVGRSDASNDVLTTRLAKGNDLFFHLDGAPGSHVILRTGGQTDAPPESVLDACELAVHFSKSKNAGQADVHVAPIKLVKKPKGAKPGLVYVTGGKSIHLRREESRLTRLLEAQFED